MSKHGRFNIRRWVNGTGGSGITFWCHGCQGAHTVMTSEGGWRFNGDYDNPVLHPSIRTFVPAKVDEETGQVLVPERTLCHSFVGSNGAEPGEIIFLGDSSNHNLRGAHPLQPWPSYHGYASEEPDTPE